MERELFPEPSLKGETPALGIAEEEDERRASQREETSTFSHHEAGQQNNGLTGGKGQVGAPRSVWSLFRPLGHLGPGLVGGLSGNDPSAVTSYVLDGAQVGFGHLWLLLLSTAFYQAVLYGCAKVGRVTQRSFTAILRDHYGPAVAFPATLVLLLANVALISADLVAIGAGGSLLTGLDYRLFLLPVAGLLWSLTVFGSFRTLKRMLFVLSLAFAAYLLTTLIERPRWPVVLLDTVWPHLDGNWASISSVVALLGATISPYTMFWQVQGEREVQRPGSRRHQFRLAAWDMATGVLIGNLVAYCIILSSASALFFQQGQSRPNVQTAADVARSLAPLAGPYASELFAIGLIGAGLVAIPILLASTSDAVAGAFGWSSGLSRHRWETGGFYVTLTVALCVSLALALAGIHPIQLMFWANVLCGLLAPVLVVYLLLVGNSRRIMGADRLGWLTNSWLVLTVLVMAAAAVLLFYHLFTA